VLAAFAALSCATAGCKPRGFNEGGGAQSRASSASGSDEETVESPRLHVYEFDFSSAQAAGGDAQSMRIALRQQLESTGMLKDCVTFDGSRAAFNTPVPPGFFSDFQTEVCAKGASSAMGSGCVIRVSERAVPLSAVSLVALGASTARVWGLDGEGGAKVVERVAPLNTSCAQPARSDASALEGRPAWSFLASLGATPEDFREQGLRIALVFLDAPTLRARLDGGNRLPEAVSTYELGELSNQAWGR
jgi:hypothetical protein